MGAQPYAYFVPYQRDIAAALAALRRREFEAGRYSPVTQWPRMPVTDDAPVHEPRHASIEDALEDAGEAGTRSILDIERISPTPDFGVAAPLPADLLTAIFGTTQPTRAMIEANLEFFEGIGRGQALYILLYEGDKPSEILFVGYSYD